MKLWIALGIAVVLGAFIYLNQPEKQPTQPVVVQNLPQDSRPVHPVIAKKPRPIVHRVKAVVQDEENSINEENFVEAVEDEVQPQEEQQTPEALRHKISQEESTPLLQLTNFEQKKNKNSMPTLTYGNNPTKFENREVRRRRAFVAAEGDQ